MCKTKTSESNMYEAVMSETPMSKMLECPNQVSDVMVLDIFISDILFFGHFAPAPFFEHIQNELNSL
jgi:hypothetical protein